MSDICFPRAPDSVKKISIFSAYPSAPLSERKHIRFRYRGSLLLCIRRCTLKYGFIGSVKLFITLRTFASFVPALTSLSYYDYSSPFIGFQKAEIVYCDFFQRGNTTTGVLGPLFLLCLYVLLFLLSRPLVVSSGRCAESKHELLSLPRFHRIGESS